MKRWLYDNPWIWIVLFIAVFVGLSFAFLVIAEFNKPVVIPTG